MEEKRLQKWLKQKGGSGLMVFIRQAGFQESAVRLGTSPRAGSQGKASSQQQGTVQHSDGEGNCLCRIMERGDKKAQQRGVGEFLAAGIEVSQGCQKQKQRRQENKGFVKGV